MFKRLCLGGLVALVVLGAAPVAGAGTARERIAQHRREIAARMAHHTPNRAPAVRRDHAGVRREVARPHRNSARPHSRAVRPHHQAPAPRPSGPVAPRSTGKVIEVVIGEQVLRAWNDGRLVMETPVSTGARGSETPTGSFSILSKERSHWSRQFHVHMPYAMRVVRGIFIHELPISPDGRRLGTTSLGHPVSHGCIRVGIGAAARLYEWTPVGTPVVIR